MTIFFQIEGSNFKYWPKPSVGTVFSCLSLSYICRSGLTSGCWVVPMRYRPHAAHYKNSDNNVAHHRLIFNYSEEYFRSLFPRAGLVPCRHHSLLLDIFGLSLACYSSNKSRLPSPSLSQSSKSSTKLFLLSDIVKELPQSDGFALAFDTFNALRRRASSCSHASA